MPRREVDKRKTMKALRKLRRASERAGAEGGPGLTQWEQEFVEGVSERLETYGSAFRDPAKGRLEEALSERQSQVVRVIDKKSRKAQTPLKTGTPLKPKAPDAGERSNRLPGSTFRRKPAKAIKRQPMKRGSGFGRSSGPRVRDANGDVPAPESPEEKRAGFRVLPGGAGEGKT